VEAAALICREGFRMQAVFPIRDLGDVRRIESRPYAEFMPHASVTAALQDSARRHAERRALTFITSADPAAAPRGWTYREFVDTVLRTANLFRRLAGVEAPRVAMLLPAIPQAYFTLWGAEAAGVVCPINYLLDAEHIAELIRASGANILVALGPSDELDIWSRVPALLDHCPGLRHVLAVGGAEGQLDFDEEVAAAETQAPPSDRAADPDRLTALFHTGGTTGAPKLAQHTHRNQLHAAWSAAQLYAMDERDVILNGFPLFHVAGAFVFGLSALLSGAEVVLPTQLGMRNQQFVQRYWTFADRHAVSLLAAVPTVIAALLDVDRGDARLASVRALLTGGSPLPTELASAFEKRFDIPVRNILGMTECAGVVSIEPFGSARTPGSCGLALPFTEVKAVNIDGRDCEDGESGILRLRGPNVGPGYTDARRNAGTFTEDGWLVTGDIGHVDASGRIFVTGRAKDVIIRGGHNIDPQVIEEALLSHPDVQMAAAVGAPDEYAGELPVAFVTLKPGATVDPQALMAFANARIPERPAFPKRIDIIPAVPMTAIGKVYKPALRARACLRVLEERVSRGAMAGRVRVSVEESASGLAVKFEARPGIGRDEVEAEVRQLMQPYAIAYAVVDPTADPGDLP
jgi:fatty-acyl-CoA synthase